MAKLYGLPNYLITEMATKLMLHPDFYKFVHYKDINENGEDILEQPDLDSPIEILSQGKREDRQVFLNRRPDKILHGQDVNIFIYFDDMKNYTAKSKRIKTVSIKIGILIHEQCLATPNGSRDICIISAIESILEGSKFVKGLGTCEVVRANQLFGLPVEYTGYEMLCHIDGFPAKLTTIEDKSDE